MIENNIFIKKYNFIYNRNSLNGLLGKQIGEILRCANPTIEVLEKCDLK